jgi:hypothetical protein
MLAIMKMLIADILAAPSRAIWSDGSDQGVREYFRSEFKKDYKGAYEYWLSTGNANYQC